MKTLYIISKGIGKASPEEIINMERQNRIPRVTLLEEAINAEVLDERFLNHEVPAFRKWLYRKLPVHISQILEALIIHRRYDVILSQSEKVAFPLAYGMKWLRMKTPHVFIISRITSVDEKQSLRKIWFMKKVKDSVSKFLIWSISQRDMAIEQLGVHPEKIVLINRGTDQKFWKPDKQQEGVMISAAGMEARDYPTLIEALRPLDIPCHIAVSTSRGELFETVKALYNILDIPDHITVGRKTHEELRELYARSRFVVVPLMQSDSDNGLTTILESMAMGKPVICSRTQGQIGIIEEGVNGCFVPQGDPEALREKILELWNDPECCEKMGQEGRRFIEDEHNMEQFVERIKEEIQTVLPETDNNEVAGSLKYETIP